MSYDVSSLFTNVPVDETIEILAEKAFKDNWFNKEHDLTITKTDLIELLEVATKIQLFQFEGNLVFFNIYFFIAVRISLAVYNL